MLELIGSEKSFFAPLLRSRSPDHGALDVALPAEGERLRGDGSGANKSNQGGWHSEGSLLDDPAAPIGTLRRAAVLSEMEATEPVTSKVA
jgi:hypothetical protein